MTKEPQKLDYSLLTKKDIRKMKELQKLNKQAELRYIDIPINDKIEEGNNLLQRLNDFIIDGKNNLDFETLREKYNKLSSDILEFEKENRYYKFYSNYKLDKLIDGIKEHLQSHYIIMLSFFKLKYYIY